MAARVKVLKVIGRAGPICTVDLEFVSLLAPANL